MYIIACIEDPVVIEKILTQLDGKAACGAVRRLPPCRLCNVWQSRSELASRYVESWLLKLAALTHVVRFRSAIWSRCERVGLESVEACE